MQLSVIIVSYNVKYYLEQCLYSVLAACKDISAEIIVVDNHSEDNSILYLQAKFPGVIFIQENTNDGFAKANNKGLQMATGKYILFLNPDTIVAEDTITGCILYLESHPQAGAIGVKMVDGTGNFLPESKRAFPSVSASFFKLSGLSALFPGSPVFNKYSLGHLDKNEIHEADVLSGAFFLSRKNLLEKLNGFDESFFMYGEDIDLSYRIRQEGYQNIYLGNYSIIHFKGESTKKDKVYVKNFYGAMKIFVNKHYSKASSFFLYPAISCAAFFSKKANDPARILPGEKMKNEKIIFVLLGNEDALHNAEAALSTGNFKPGKVINNGSSIQENEIKNILPASRIVFCIGRLTYSACIQFVQEYKNKFSYYWHYKNSCSIVAPQNCFTLPQIDLQNE